MLKKCRRGCIDGTAKSGIVDRPVLGVSTQNQSFLGIEDWRRMVDDIIFQLLSVNVLCSRASFILLLPTFLAFFFRDLVYNAHIAMS